MGYHNKEIERGKFGKFSKIKEEFLEAEDALEQNNTIMLLVELSDLIGAIEGYCLKNHNISIDDLLKMKEATKKAFNNGTRNSRD
jgi:phosphoribosyl-ATP pyrophosphohydrolase